MLKFKTFKFNLKFIWNWSFFHYEKIMRFKKLFSNVVPDRHGQGIILGVTRLLLLGLFFTIQTKRDQTFWRGVYIEPRNREKSLTLIWQHFSCLLDEWIAKISKKKFSRWLFEIIHIIRSEIWDLEIWKKFWDMTLTI